MSEMVPFSAGLSKRDARAVGRELSRLEGRGRVAVARIEQEADLQASRVSAVAYVGRRGMSEAAMLGVAEQQLASTCPGSAGRVSYIADVTTMQIGEVIAETVRRVR